MNDILQIFLGIGIVGALVGAYYIFVKQVFGPFPTNKKKSLDSTTQEHKKQDEAGLTKKSRDESANLATRSIW